MQEQRQERRNDKRRNDRIEVLLASYNGEAYIAEQLDSILNQTVVPDRILISDDGSKDATGKILEEYQRQYPEQIVLLPHEKIEPADEVPAAAKNFFWLLRHAQGDYVLLSDQDDVWKREKVEILLAKMQELERTHGREVPILIHSDMEVVDAKLNRIHSSFFAYQKGNPERRRLSEVLVENPVTGGAVMMNRALADLLKEMPKACVMHDWWIAMTAACFGVIAYVPQALYCYRQHGSNTLGARRIGSAKEVRERLKQQEKVEAGYRAMFLQAAAFEAQFGLEMAPEERSLLRAYRALFYQSAPGRLKNIVRNHFFKSSLLQTLAQCVTIPKAENLLAKGR